MHIVSKSRGLIEKVKSDYEIVCDLERKLGNTKILEGANKWKMNGFLGITGIVYTNCYS